jgi:hypothetical protein
MTAIGDLQPCTLVGNGAGFPAIGWLGRGVTHATGPTPRDVFERLSKLCERSWQPFASAGGHKCELCQFEPPMMTGMVFVPGQGCIYIAPLRIIHYMSTHWYQPPDVFIRAVLACPSMGSMAYKRAILSNGGRDLVKQLAAV